MKNAKKLLKNKEQEAWSNVCKLLLQSYSVLVMQKYSNGQKE